MKYFLPMLAILFIGLKLSGAIEWSWLWVLSPLWIGLLSAVIMTIILNKLNDE